MTDPRQVEDVLHDHGAPDQDRQLQADEGDNRDEGIFDAVPDNHDPLPEPLGPGGADIVLPEHLQIDPSMRGLGGPLAKQSRWALLKEQKIRIEIDKTECLP